MFGAKDHDRAHETATDTASTESAMVDFWNANAPTKGEDKAWNAICLIQATSPLLAADDLRRGVATFRKQHVDSVLSVHRLHMFRWLPSGESEVLGAVSLNYDPKHRPRRQDWCGDMVENGAFYITSAEAWRDSECRVSGRTELVEMSNQRSTDVDTRHDLLIVNAVLKGRTDEDEDADAARK